MIKIVHNDVEVDIMGTPTNSEDSNLIIKALFVKLE